MDRTTIKEIEERLSGKVTINGIDDFVIKSYHLFMKTYGYINYNEFLNIPFGLFNSLFKEIKDDGVREKGKKWQK